MSNSKVAFARPKSAADDLGANTMPTGAWPPRNEYLVQFFAAPIKLDGRLGVEDSDPQKEDEDGLVYARPTPDLPDVGDKLMCGIELIVNDTPIVQWVAAECKSDSQVLLAGESECSELSGQRWMLESEYESFTAAVALLSDADVKDDEELAVDLVKKARGETPQPRKPWGASRGSGIAIGGASMIKRDFLVEESMGLHLNLKTLEVVRVDPKTQGSTARVGWKVVEINGEAVRNAYDLKVALAKLREEAAAAGGGGRGGVRASADEEPSTRRGPREMRWTFEVPASSSGLGNGPPISVLSAQVVRLCGKHDESCRLSCKHMPKLAFRLDPNAQYVDLLGRPIEAAPRYYPEGIEKMAMDSEGLFLPQNGHRIPQFGETLEAALAADVHIDTAKTTKFPSSVPSASPYVETHGAYPDPLAQAIEEKRRIHKNATSAVAARSRKSAERAEQERKEYEEHSVWASTELQTLKTTAIRDVEASAKAQINAARAEASHFRKQSLHYQQQLMETQRRSADPQTRMRMLPKPPHNGSVASSSSPSASPKRLQSLLATNEDTSPVPPLADSLPGNNENSDETNCEVAPPLPPPPPKPAAAQQQRPLEHGWWNRMHGAHSERLEKRDKDHAEKVALEKEYDSWCLSQQKTSGESGVKTTRAAAKLATKVSAVHHLEREAAFMKKQEYLRPDNPLLRHSSETTFDSAIHTSTLAASRSSRVMSGNNKDEKSEEEVKKGYSMSKACPACGFVPRFNATNPRGLKRGMQVEAQHSSSVTTKEKSGSGALFYRGTILAVRTKGNCDIAYEEGAIKQETNVPPSLIRLPLKGGGSKGRCMCSTRKHLGYAVKKQSTNAPQQLPSAGSLDYSIDCLNNTTTAAACSSSTDAAREVGDAAAVANFNSSSLYRGETTTLARTWQQTFDNLKQKESFEAAHGGACDEERLDASRSVTNPWSITPQAQAFVERQAAWNHDRYERAQEKRRVQEAAATTPWHLNKPSTRKAPHEQVKKFADDAPAIRSAADTTGGASQENLPPPPLFQSTFEPELDEHCKDSSSPAPEPPQPPPLISSSKPQQQPPLLGSDGMAQRWADQTKGRIVKQLCSQNHRFNWDTVKAAIASEWAAMETKAAAAAVAPSATEESNDDGAHVAERSLAVSPMLSNWTVKQRDEAISKLTADALKDLHQQLPGQHWVGASVKVLPVKSPKRAGPGGSVIEPPQPVDAAASEVEAAKMGVVLSFDNAKQRFVVEIQTNGAAAAVGEGEESQRKAGKVGLVTCDADRVVLVAKKRGPQAKLYSKTGEPDQETSKEVSSSSHDASRWSTSRLDALGANKIGPEKVYYVTNQSKGRLQALATAKEAEAEAVSKEKKRLAKQDKLRALLATTARATKALKAQIAVAVSAARAAKVNPKEDPEVIRLEALLFNHLNKNVYTNLMRGTSAAASGVDDTMDLDAILANSGKSEGGDGIGSNIEEGTAAGSKAPAAPSPSDTKSADTAAADTVAADTAAADTAAPTPVPAPVESSTAEEIPTKTAPPELTAAKTTTADTAVAEKGAAAESGISAAERREHVVETAASNDPEDENEDNESYEYDQGYENEEEESGGDGNEGGADV